MTLLETLWRETVLHLWQTTLVLGVIALLGRSLRFAPAGYQHALWWIALAALVLPLTLVRPFWQLVIPDAPIASPFVAYASVAVRPPLVAAGATAVSSSGSIWIILLTGAWALGAVWLFARWVAESQRVGPLFPCRLDFTAGQIQRKVLAAIRGTDIPQRRIYVGEARIMPSVTGLAHPRILLPRRVVDALDPEELRSVLLHENWHCRRRDPLLAALQRATLAVFFFYPPAWWLVRRLRDSAEIVYDAAVLRADISAETYARALARALSLDLLPVSDAATGLGRASGLGQRLDRIDHPWRYRVMLKHRLSVAAMVMAMAAVSYLPLRAAAGVQDGTQSSAETRQPAADQRRAVVLDFTSASDYRRQTPGVERQQSERSGGLAGAIEDVQRRAADLADEEAEIADEVASLGNLPKEQIDRLIERKDRMVAEVADLEQDLDSTSAEFLRDERDASRALQDAANGIRESKLKERIRYSRGLARARAAEYAREFEEEIGGHLGDLERHLADAAEAVNRR